MPRYAPTANMVHAVLFDGSTDTAVSAAQVAGASGTLVFPDGKPILRVNGSEVIPPVWIIRGCGGAVTALMPAVFEAEYFLIDRPPPDPALPILPALADKHAPPAERAPGAIREGDIVRDTVELDPKLAAEPLEVLEIDHKNRILVCDWAWGTKTIPLAAAVVVQAGT